MNEASEIGRRGEEAAVEYLRREGFRICARNWRNGRYEIDVVACRGWEIRLTNTSVASSSPSNTVVT